MTTGFIYDSRFLLHDAADLPERPERLRRVMAQLKDSGVLKRLTRLKAKAAPLDVVRLVHPEPYPARLRQAARSGERLFDSEDVIICPKSYSVALLGVGAALVACDAVMAGAALRGKAKSRAKKSATAGRSKIAVDNAFCAIRPPGHHAEVDRAMGFCLFNNVAIAARYLQNKHRIRRVAIVDWDVHHGNGTQHIFERDPSVLFISLHENPAVQYPGTGFAHERGVGPGVGKTLNLPFQPGATDDEYKAAFTSHVLPALRKFEPEFLLISAGFDAHHADPLGHLALTEAGFAWMTRELKRVAAEHCQGRLVSLLEGGYNLAALAASVQAHVEALLWAPQGP